MKQFLSIVLRYASKNWISIAALAVSLWLLYREHLRPFLPEVRTAGRISLAKNPWSPGLKEASLLLDLILTNNGVKRGIIHNVALSIEAPDGSSSLFRAFAVMGDRSLQLQKELMPPKLETFIDIELGKGESIVRRLFFIPYVDSVSFSFQSGHHHAEVWILHTGERKWRRTGMFSFLIENSDLDQIGKSQVQTLPEGGFFVNWKIQDKATIEADKQIADLVGQREYKKEIRRKHEEALIYFNKVIELNPDDAAAWHKRGILLGKLGKFIEELESYDKAIKLTPEVAETWHNRGLALKDLKKHNEALASIEKALELKPDYAEAWHNKGVLLKILGRQEEANDSFRKARELGFISK